MSAPASPGGDCNPQAAAELFRALAHPMRVRILCRLLDGEVSVAGLESELGLKQPSLSQQLGQLRDAGIVATRRAAKSVYYSLSDQRVRIILDALRAAADGASPASTHPAFGAAPLAAWSRGTGQPASPRATAPQPPLVRPGNVECGVFAVVGQSAYE
jgi:DNA-binding transcriptional ArsR family regulator